MLNKYYTTLTENKQGCFTGKYTLLLTTRFQIIQKKTQGREGS
jgi:hypothetical protein